MDHAESIEGLVPGSTCRGRLSGDPVLNCGLAAIQLLRKADNLNLYLKFLDLFSFRGGWVRAE